MENGIMSTSEVIELAARRAVETSKGMQSSAALALSDARRLAGQGNLRDARNRALDSLRYSVGILHEDYARAIRQSAVRKGV